MRKHTSLALGILMSVAPAAVCGGLQPVFTTSLVKTGLYTISSGGGNSVLRLTAQGLILVDGQDAGVYDSLQAQIQRVSKQPVMVLIDTGAPRNTGDNEQFRRAGTAILGQQNLVRRPASGSAPSRTFDREFDMKVGDIEVKALHFGSARTNADCIVYFPNLKSVAMGALFAASPEPDYAAGGSLVGWGHTLAELLNLDFDIAIPAEGPVVTRLQVQELREKIEVFVSRGRALVSAGASRDRVLEAVKQGSFGFSLELDEKGLNGVFDELSSENPH